jgi:hypothetical protein
VCAFIVVAVVAGNEHIQRETGRVGDQPASSLDLAKECSIENRDQRRKKSTYRDRAPYNLNRVTPTVRNGHVAPESAVTFTGIRKMGKLHFEDIVGVNTPYPYVFVYMLEESETLSPSAFAPFMALAVQQDRSLLMTVFESANSVSLKLEQLEILLDRYPVVRVNEECDRVALCAPFFHQAQGLRIPPIDVRKTMTARQSFVGSNHEAHQSPQRFSPALKTQTQ